MVIKKSLSQINLILKLACLFSFIFLLIRCDSPAEDETNPPKKAEQAIALPIAEKEAAEFSFNLDYIMGKFEPAKHPDFTIIEAKYASRNGMYLRKEVYEAFQKMYNAAQKDGIQLVIKSATRNFYSQKQIWEGKWTGQRKIENGKDASKTYPNPTKRALKILEYSSMPGTSRHHWGTDIDMNNFTNEYFEKGKGLKEYEWLIANGATFGFCQPYTAKGTARPNGYNEEKWHWTYNPTAQLLTAQAKSQLKAKMISGFKGSDTAMEIDVVEQYVLGINKDCMNN